MKPWLLMLAGLFLLTAESESRGAGKAPVSPYSFYEDNPTFTDPVNDDADWVTAPPGHVGLDERLLRQAGDAFGKKSWSFSFLVLRRGTLAYERYFHGTHKRSSNNVHSASKSILGAAVGIALERGELRSLDQPLAELLPGAKAGITLRHLLTHSSGMRWTEDSTENEIERRPHWVNAILALPYGRPGEKWNYTTGGTHLLSAALQKATGESLASYTRRQLFAPLGIRDERWGSDPQGVSSGGYNLYLTARELAKFGQLFLQGGRWQGQQVVPRAWVEESFRAHISPRKGSEYGLLWWQRKIGGFDVKFAWGYGGQLVYVVPALEMVVVFTTDTSGRDPDFEGDSLLEKYVLRAAR